MSPRKPQIDRRSFLLRCARAATASAITAGVGSWLYNRHPPGSLFTKQAQQGLRDFSIAGLGPKMSVVTGSDREKTVTLGLKALGGIESFVKKGERVLIKVNAAFASPAILGATAHPDLVIEVVRLCLQAGAKEVLVTDNPINDPRSCFLLSGIARAVQEGGGRLVLPTEDLFAPLTVPGGTLIRQWPALLGVLSGVDRLIGIAPVKQHNRSGASMSMKNWYGLLGGRRNKFHQDIHNIIMELAMMVRPTLVILDGTTAMMRNGPTGGAVADLKPTQTMIISTDQVAADAVGATLLGKSVADLPYIQKAAAAGCGTAKPEDLNPIRLQAG